MEPPTQNTESTGDAKWVTFTENSKENISEELRRTLRKGLFLALVRLNQISQGRFYVKNSTLLRRYTFLGLYCLRTTISWCPQKSATVKRAKLLFFVNKIFFVMAWVRACVIITFVTCILCIFSLFVSRSCLCCEKGNEIHHMAQIPLKAACC